MKAAIYARVSTRDKGQDPENQLRELREYCQRCGWVIYAEYVDQSTAKNSDRDEFKKMFAAAAERRFEIVITWALDRFTREGVAETFVHIKRLKGYGVGFESFTEPHFRTTGAAGELMIAVAAWIAEQERERLRERVRASVARARAAGKKLGRPLRIWNRETARELRAAGMSWRKLSKRLGIPFSTLRDHINDR